MKKQMRKHETFAQWAADQTPKHKTIIRALRKLMKKVAPTLTESVKWTNGCWIGEEWPVAFLHAEEDHLQFGFFGGSALSDPKGLLEGRGKFVRHIKIRKASDINETPFARLIRQAVKIERE